MLAIQWYQTPLDYLSQDHFSINIHWNYYTRLAYILRVRIFTRPVKSRPWDRFPSDTWFCPSWEPTIPVFLSMIFFSILLLIAWNFHFPTPVERNIWRACGVYNVAWNFYGGAYYLLEMLKSRKESLPSLHFHWYRRENSEDTEHPRLNSEKPFWKLPLMRRFLNLWEDALPPQDPVDRISLRVLMPISIICLLYIPCRLYIYIEDFISLREQPAHVYRGTDLLGWIFGS